MVFGVDVNYMGQTAPTNLPSKKKGGLVLRKPFRRVRILSLKELEKRTRWKKEGQVRDRELMYLIKEPGHKHAVMISLFSPVYMTLEATGLHERARHAIITNKHIPKPTHPKKQYNTTPWTGVQS